MEVLRKHWEESRVPQYNPEILLFKVVMENLYIVDNAIFHLLCTSALFLIENPSNFLQSPVNSGQAPSKKQKQLILMSMCYSKFSDFLFSSLRCNLIFE